MIKGFLRATTQLARPQIEPPRTPKPETTLIFLLCSLIVILSAVVVLLLLRRRSYKRSALGVQASKERPRTASPSSVYASSAVLDEPTPTLGQPFVPDKQPEPLLGSWAAPCLSACLEPALANVATSSRLAAADDVVTALGLAAVDNVDACSDRLRCESVGEHVMALRWPATSRSEGNGLSAALKADYEVARRILAARDTPFGLVHDFRHVKRLQTLMPIGGQVLPDAIAIAQGGLVRRVAVVHSFNGTFTRGMLESLVRLSPVRPSQLFRAPDAENAHEWAAAWVAA